MCESSGGRADVRPNRALLAVASSVLLAACSQPFTGPAAPRPGAVLPAALPDAPDEITTVQWTREPWRFGDVEGQMIVTLHHRLHTTIDDRYLLERLPLFLERSLAHYTSALAHLPRPEGALETYLFDDRNQWEAKTRQMLPEQARAFLALGRGGFTTRGISVLYDIGRRDTLAIAAHEGWHQYAQRVFEDPLPIWLEEGVATYMEGYLTYPDGVPKFRPWANRERYWQLRDATRRGRLIPLAELVARRPESFLQRGTSRLLVYYAQVWALTHFLAEGDGGHYRESLEQILHDAAEGSSARYRRVARDRLGSGVLAEYFEADLERFEASYLEFIAQVTRSGGRDRIVRGRSPVG